VLNKAFCMIFTAVALSTPVVASAHEPGTPERSIVLEIGAAGEWDAKKLSSGKYGGTVAVEIEPIDGWLEVELGIAAVTSGGRTELGADLLFQKPWAFSPKFEFMVGLGPSVSHHLKGDDRGTSYGIDFALDFMFWPTKKVGWYVEPTYGIGLGKNKEKSLAATAGVLISW